MKVILIICGLLFHFKISAQIPPMVDEHSKWEVYYDKVPVSGEIRVGALSYENDDKIKPTSFFVKIPEHTENILCVEISSRDGRYEANLPYNIQKLQPNIYEFALPTKHTLELKKYSIKDITILAKIGRDCKSEQSYFVLSAWNKATISNESFIVYLNSENPTFLKFKNKVTSEIETVECEKITNTFSIAYNCKCVVAKAKLSGVTDFVIQQRVRRGTNIYFNSYNFPIKF